MEKRPFQYIDTYKFGNETLNDTKIASYLLERFIRRLRSYIHHDSFDSPRFDSVSMKLGKRLSTIDFMVQNLTPSHEILMTQLQFAENMFNVMSYCTEKLKSFSQNISPGFTLVNKMIELNLRAMSLDNSHGKLDLSIRGHTEKLSLLYCNVVSVTDQFQNLPNKPLRMRFSFGFEAVQTRKTLDSLQGQSFLPHNISESCAQSTIAI
ncbi:hypothetical protein JCM33374_g5121 [Metschnikowia sp. JCM 33374]|nr:hypothetical protein JCM33374_g5121 [Metschnikowia sp. JCM 33374]